MESSLMRSMVALGALLIAGVVLWVLSRGSYRGDIDKICHAETTSGAHLAEHQATVTRWIGGNLDTPEGNLWFKELIAKPLPERREALEAEAKRVGVASCPLGQSFDDLIAVGQYAGDLGALCTLTGLADIAQLPDDERAAKLTAWGPTAKSQKTRDLIAKLVAAEPKARGPMLRQAVSEHALLQCDLATVLSKPPTAADPTKPVRAVRAEVNGGITEAAVLGAVMAGIEPLNLCYATASAHAKSPIHGQFAMRMTLDGGGKVATSRAVSGPTSDNALAECMGKALKGIEFGAISTRVSSVTLHLDVGTPPAKPADAPLAAPDAGAPFAAPDAGAAAATPDASVRSAP